MFKISTMFAVMIAFFGILTVTRHTRHNEETGCEELTGSTVVGRHASLLAALIVATAGSILLAVLLALAFIVNGHPVDGSFAAGAALGAVGVAFAGVAAITAQLADTTRGANGLAGLVMGAAFLVSILVGPFFGPALDLPLWVQNISPFTHVPAVTEPVSATPIIVMLLIAAVLTAIGFLSYSRRSIIT